MSNKYMIILLLSCFASSALRSTLVLADHRFVPVRFANDSVSATYEDKAYTINIFNNKVNIKYHSKEQAINMEKNLTSCQNQQLTLLLQSLKNDFIASSTEGINISKLAKPPFSSPAVNKELNGFSINRSAHFRLVNIELNGKATIALWDAPLGIRVRLFPEDILLILARDYKRKC